MSAQNPTMRLQVLALHSLYLRRKIWQMVICCSSVAALHVFQEADARVCLALVQVQGCHCTDADAVVDLDQGSYSWSGVCCFLWWNACLL